MKPTISSIVVLLLICLTIAQPAPVKATPVSPAGRDIRVGTDVKTIRDAIKLAQPGDTIHLQPIVYHESAIFQGKKGEPGKPITLDGHGATLECADPLNVTKWKEMSPGLFANDELLPPSSLNDAAIMRWFFLWNGKMNHMGRTSKGVKAPFKKAEDLQPGEWTFVRDQAREKPGSPQLCGTFFVKLPPGQKLADANIAAPIRINGVHLGGDNAHLIIKNIPSTHPHNDGFNIHGDCRDIRFENIRAIECGDDGISSHESAEVFVDGLVSMGNSTGITDILSAHTSYNHVFIADCLAFDLFFLNNGRYKVENSVILSSSEHPLVVRADKGEHTELILDNVFILRACKPEPALFQKDTKLTATRVTLKNTTLTALGEANYENCLINGKPMPEGASATGADHLKLIQKLVPAEYQKRFTQLQ